MADIPTAPEAGSVGSWSSAAPVTRDVIPWWSVLILGIASVLFGVAVLAWPGVSLKIMAVMVGVWLVLGGIARIVGAFLRRDVGLGRHVLSGVIGVVVLIAGLVCLRNLVTALGVLALMVALAWILGGVSWMVWGMQTAGGTRIALMTVGLLSLVAGLVFLFAPGLSLATLVLMTGISGIVVGIAELVLAYQLRKLPV